MTISCSKGNLTKEDLKEVFLSGIKPKSKFKIGVEVEKLPVKKKSYKAVSYYEKNGIKSFLEKLSKEDDWEKIHSEGHLLGLKKEGNSITLEPGSQFEIAINPSNNIHDIAHYLEQYHKITGELASQMDFMWLGYGIQPISTHHDIEVIPKSRYKLMGEYLPTKGVEPLVMMRETAGLQVALDYNSEQDAINKLRLGLKIAPIISTMFANSPIRAGCNTGYKSYRAHSWLNTDPDRCGFISEKLFNPNQEFTFNDYIETVLDIPMIFIERNGKPVQVQNHTFRTFLEYGYEGTEATKADWELHSSLFFPDVRMKNFIEFRNADCQNQSLSLAIMAIYKGLFYDDVAINETIKLTEDFDWKTLNLIRNISPKQGLNIKIKEKNLTDITVELIAIANRSLIRQNLGEESYLEVLKNYTLKGKTPADVLIDFCGKDINKLVEFTHIV